MVAGRRVRLHGREWDAGEVRNYWKALLRVEEWAARNPSTLAAAVLIAKEEVLHHLDRVSRSAGISRWHSV